MIIDGRNSNTAMLAMNYVRSIVDGGASGDAITLALPADAAVIPQVMFTVKQG